MDHFLQAASDLFLRMKKKEKSKEDVVFEKEEPKRKLKDNNLSKNTLQPDSGKSQKSEKSEKSQNDPSAEVLNVPNAGDSERGNLKNKGKLFVGGLSYSTTSKELTTYFSVFGKVIDSIVMRHPTSGKSRGFGFVTFANVEDAEKALLTQDHALGGRTIECRRFDAKGDSQKRRNFETRVFLGGLPSNVTKEELKQFFSRYGEVAEVFIPQCRKTNEAKGYGFVAFKEEDSAKKCLADRFVYLKEKRVFINRADCQDRSSCIQHLECDDSISIDSGSLSDEDTQSSSSDQRLIEFERHPELKQFFDNYFLKKLVYYDELNEANVKYEKPKFFNSDVEELGKKLKDVLINSDSEHISSATEADSSDEDDYENHALSQEEFGRGNLDFLSDKSTRKPLQFTREESASNLSCVGPTVESPPKPSSPFVNSSTGSLMCPLCQWTPADMSFDAFLAHCKTSAHRSKLKERFSAEKTQESEPEINQMMTNKKLKNLHSELRSYPNLSETQKEDSENRNKTEGVQKCRKKQQIFSHDKQQQILQRLQEQQQQEVKERRQQTKQQKPQKQKEQSKAPKEQQCAEQKQGDILKEVRRDGISATKKQKSQNLQQNRQQEPENKEISNSNLKVYALAKGMSCIQPVSENELSCKMCNKKIPKASDFDVLMKNVSQHLNSKNHLRKLLETEEALKKVEKGPTLGTENNNPSGNNIQVKKKPEIHKIANQSSPGGSKASSLKERTSNAPKNCSKGKDVKTQIAKPEHVNSASAKKLEKSDPSRKKYLCLQCNYCAGSIDAFNQHLNSKSHE